MNQIESIVPVNVMASGDGGWILDMGMDMTGWLHFRLNEKRGAPVRMQFAEHLLPNARSLGAASTEIAVKGEGQPETYICRVGGTGRRESGFSFHAFRYVQIKGLSRKPNLKDFSGWWIRVDQERIASHAIWDALSKKLDDVST